MPEPPIDVLLIEDDPKDVEMTRYAFEHYRLSNRIHVVRDGAEALDFIFGAGAYAGRNVEDVPRVILLDLKLPKVGGIEVLRRLKSDPRTRAIPVVVMTSSREERDAVEAYTLGANSYIVKPLDFATFTEAVRQVGLYWLLLNEPSTG
jgi:two-component system response regulator